MRRRLAKQEKAIEIQWRKLGRTQFSCKDDSEADLQKFSGQLQWWWPNARVEPVKKHRRRGRSAHGQTPEVIGWQIQGDLVVDEAAVAEKAQWLGRFILATNMLDETTLTDDKPLSCYKEQSSSVERGFHFLKDPMFFADGLFLKSPVRIMAMGLAILIYALAEREIQPALVQQDETIPHQTGKPTQKVTMRRIAQIFEDVDLPIIKALAETVSQRVLNLTPVRLFNPAIQNCYLLEFWCEIWPKRHLMSAAVYRQLMSVRLQDWRGMTASSGR